MSIRVRQADRRILAAVKGLEQFVLVSTKDANWWVCSNQRNQEVADTDAEHRSGRNARRNNALC